MLGLSVPLEPAQSDPEILRVMEEQRSWVVIDDDGSMHLRTDALAVVISHSWARPLAPWLRRKRVERIGDSIYRWIERNRGRLSHLVGWLPDPRRSK